jgi:hypothetical protein
MELYLRYLALQPERSMPNSNSLSYRAGRYMPRRPLREIPKSNDPLWCEVRDTPWVSTMRCQVATAALVAGLGFTRAWRFRRI